MTFGEFLSEVVVSVVDFLLVMLRAPAEWVIFCLLLVYLGYKWKQRKVKEKRNE